MDPEIIEETQLSPGNISDEIERTENVTKMAPEEVKAMTSAEDESRLNFYIQRLKVAVAVAVIKSAPPEMTPEEYASHLIQCFKEDNSKWRDKYEILEKEVIELEQRLQTVALKEKLNILDIDLDLAPKDNPLLRMSQHCATPSPNLKRKISSTIDFVRSFILLGSVSNENFESTKEREKLQENVLRSISLLFGYLRSREGLSLEFEITKCAMEEVNRLFNSKANFFEKDLVNVSMTFVDNLLLDIYKSLEINMMDFQHRRSTLIQMLAEQKLLTALILSRLLREITILSDSLASVFETQAEDFTPILRVENTYYVLQTTEGTLHTMRQQNSALNVIRIPKTLLVEWSKTTEKSLLVISSHFPMYSIYVWHVKALLESVLDSDN